ncbi:hypothetical protein GCM10009639_64490 [Kitasatospora putterlickiae]|uniref:Uncharacterized protein n=1 Tax=Kitasatospora putterlickiae TaxID=221725 RepID=A0ABN1YGH4_9ACTN
MDLTPNVAAQPGAAPIAGLPDAWHWSRAIFNIDAILTQDREHLLEMRVMGRYDAALAQAVLTLARERSTDITESDRPLVALAGLASPDWTFDTVAAVSPDVHDNHAQDDTDLHRATWTLFPGHSCEFSGTETQEEARHLFRLALRPTKLDRDPIPFLRMRYHNTRTRSHSVGPDRGIAPLSVLLNELSLLDGAPGSVVEWENRTGELLKVEAATDLLLLRTTTGDRPITVNDLLALAEHSVFHADEPE